MQRLGALGFKLAEDIPDGHVLLPADELVQRDLYRAADAAAVMGQDVAGDSESAVMGAFL